MEFIGTGCFAMCEGLTEVIIPDTVLRIGNQAFNSCPNLTKVQFSNSLQFIGSYAFTGCTNLQEIDLQVDSSICTIGKEVFARCPKLKTVHFGDFFTTIAENMFESCGFTTLELPDAISTIHSLAFRYCTSLTKFTTAASYIGYGALLGCTSLEKVILTNEYLNLETDNPGYSIFDQCSVLNTAGPLGSGKDIEFAWREKIPDYAFMRNRYSYSNSNNSLSEVVLPNTLTSIGIQAFKNSVFTTIDLPLSLTTIGEAAFEGC